MRTAQKLLWAALVLSALPLCRGAKDPSGGEHFDLVGIDYKKPQELSDAFFNPFKIQASIGSGSQKKDGAAVTNDTITDALGKRGVSGILYAPQGDRNRVIVGDQVFGIGDEITFPNADSDALSPLVPGASVVLRTVTSGSLGLDVTPDGEPARRIAYPLRAFWRP
jgi:hypothetical protein